MRFHAKSVRFLAFLGVAVVLLSGCWWKQTFDVTKVKCDEIDAARRTVVAEFGEQMEFISDLFWAQRRVLEDAMKQCKKDLWEGGPCDSQWEELQEAYKNARADISNDDLYDTYKKAREKWNGCSGKNFDASYKKWTEENKKKEFDCKEKFQEQVKDLVGKRAAEEQKARNKRDEDLQYLDDLEKRCGEKKAAGIAVGEPPPTQKAIGAIGGSLPDLDCCTNRKDGSKLAPINVDTAKNPPKPSIDPYNNGAGFYDASHLGITEIFYAFYQFYNGFMGRENPRKNDVVHLGGGVVDTVRQSSEIQKFDEEVSISLNTKMGPLFEELECGQKATLHAAGSKLITPDLSQTTFNLAFGRFTVYYEAQCAIGPKQCCALDQSCDTHRCDRMHYTCNIDWMMYDLYDFDSWKRALPPGWFGVDFHTFGFWKTVVADRVKECCDGEPADTSLPPPPKCEPPTKEANICKFSCTSGSCKKVYKRTDGVECYECVKNPVVCPESTADLSTCRKTCNGVCAIDYTRRDSVDCYVCKKRPVTGGSSSSVLIKVGEDASVVSSDASESEKSSSSSAKIELSSSSSSQKESCRNSNHFLGKRDCNKACTQKCIYEGKTQPNEERYCYSCPNANVCEPPTVPSEECQKTCDGICEHSYLREDGGGCTLCKQGKKSAESSSAATATADESQEYCQGYGLDSNVVCQEHCVNTGEWDTKTCVESEEIIGCYYCYAE